jgi:hypothetical protein
MVKCLWALLILSVSAEPQQVRYRQLQVGTWMVEIPSGWHYQIQSGPFLFASSKPAPPYVSRVGSFPLGNSAALYVSFRPPSERASGVTFDEWVRNKHKTRKDSFSMESQQGLPANTKLAKSCDKVGGVKEQDKVYSCAYFLERSGQRAVISIQYNYGDHRAPKYLTVLRYVALSLRPNNG